MATHRERWLVQHFPVAHVEYRLLVAGLLAAQEWLHFVVVLSTGRGHRMELSCSGMNHIQYVLDLSHAADFS